MCLFNLRIYSYNPATFFRELAISQDFLIYKGLSSQPVALY
jgi:hypothetical protein